MTRTKRTRSGEYKQGFKPEALTVTKGGQVVGIAIKPTYKDKRKERNNHDEQRFITIADTDLRYLLC